MKLASDEATTPTAWDPKRGGVSFQKRIGARDEKSLSVRFSLRRFLLGALCLEFWFMAEIWKWWRSQGAAAPIARWWRMMENDASDMFTNERDRDRERRRDKRSFFNYYYF